MLQTPAGRAQAGTGDLGLGNETLGEPSNGQLSPRPCLLTSPQARSLCTAVPINTHHCVLPASQVTQLPLRLLI